MDATRHSRGSQRDLLSVCLLEVAPGQLMLSSGRLRKPDLEMDTVVLLTSETTLLKLAKEMAGQKAQ